jgi:hypothetical protein
MNLVVARKGEYMHGTRVQWHGRPIDSWAEFHATVRRPGQRLLEKLDQFEDAVLVAGCQRSGTTAVTRLLKSAAGIVDYRFGHDDELDGALLLAGYAEVRATGRCCFQTTYLNDRFREYTEHADFRLIWILREPLAVVRSMLRNWSRAALNRLYDACGHAALAEVSCEDSALRDWLGPSALEKACASYIAKTGQTFALRDALGDRVLIVDYDDLVLNKEVLLPRICEFARVPFAPDLLRGLHTRSVGGGKRLSERDSEKVESACGELYRRASALCSLVGPDA